MTCQCMALHCIAMHGRMLHLPLSRLKRRMSERMLKGHQPTRGEDQRQWTKELATTQNQEEAEQLSMHQKAASMAREHKEAEEQGFSGKVPDWSKDLVVSCSS